MTVVGRLEMSERRWRDVKDDVEVDEVGEGREWPAGLVV